VLELRKAELWLVELCGLHILNHLRLVAVGDNAEEGSLQSS